MDWVKKNIDKFGGDPNNVIIFGESAGGNSVSIHLASPKSKGFFHKAIIQSGTYSSWNETFGKSVGNQFLRNLNCTNVACLRTKSLPEILSNQKESQYLPTVMRYSNDFPLTQMNAFVKGEFNVVPLLAGTNTDETSYFLCSNFHNLTEEIYTTIVRQQFGTLAPFILRLYPVSNYAKPIQAFIDLTSDNAFKCNAKLALDFISRKENNTFLYSFEQRPGFSNDCSRVSHTFELPYLFNKMLGSIFNYKFKPNEEKLSRAIIEHWVYFAYGNYEKLYQYKSERQNYIVFNDRIVEKTLFRQRLCRFWNEGTK
jgi:para-nitrobenzyl esterase